MDILGFVQPKGPLPEVAGDKSGSLLIMGTAACLWDDLRRYKDKHAGDRMTVNHASCFIEHIGRVDHLVTMHPEYWPMFLFVHQLRFHKSGITMPMTHSHRDIQENGQPAIETDYIWRLENHGNKSGLFAVLIALLMGYEEIILAGIPLDGSENFYYPPWLAPRNRYTSVHLDVWQEAAEYFEGKVKSLSGLTRDWFGSPL